MDFKADALLLRSVDYGENDKIVTLFTAERGKISASMKGVRKAGAKLNFASQPFCFAEYVLAERGGRYTVTAASLHDGFFSLREDICTFYAAACVTEACDHLMYEGMSNPRLLVAAVGAFEDMCEKNVAFALVKFLFAALSEAGYPVHAGVCPVCGKRLSGRMKFDFSGGSFTCADCSDGVPASESTYRAIRAAQGVGEYDADGLTRALRLLKAYFSHKTEISLSALEEYLALIG